MPKQWKQLKLREMHRAMALVFDLQEQALHEFQCVTPGDDSLKQKVVLSQMLRSNRYEIKEL